MTVLVVAMLLVAPAAASASCIRESAADQEARAEVIVDGTIAVDASGATTVSVERYVKGDGPPELTLVGAGGAGVMSSVDIAPQAGERWRLLGKLDADGSLVTTLCDGSSVLDGSDAAVSGPAPAAGDAATSGLASASGAAADSVPAPTAAASEAGPAAADGGALPTWAVVLLGGAAVVALASGGLVWHRRRAGAGVVSEHVAPPT